MQTKALTLVEKERSCSKTCITRGQSMVANSGKVG
jgi:hypothetical protein